MTRILLRRTGALGDVLQTTPVIRRLARERENAQIFVQTQHAHALFCNPDVAWAGPDAQSGEFDEAIDLDLAYEERADIHAVDAYMLKAFGDDGKGHDRSLYFRAAPVSPITGPRIVALHPNVSWPNRTLPRDWWGALVRRLSHDWCVVALGTTIDHDLREYGAVDTRGQFTLAQQAAVIREARALVCGDSMMFTLVGTTETPGVGFCTISRPERFVSWRRGELGWNFTAIPAPVPCYGCREDAGPVTFLACRYGHNNCVRSFSLDEAHEAIAGAIEGDRRTA